MEGYTKTVKGYNVINTYAPFIPDQEQISVSGVKTWDDGDNVDKLRPEQITIHLLADGERAGSLIVKPDEEGVWAYTFKDVDKFDPVDGTEIVYTVTENKVPGYTAMVSGMNVTNTHKPGEPVNPDDPGNPDDPSGKVEITVKKQWSDEDDKDKLRPGSVKVALKADTTLVQDRVAYLSSGNDWTFTFKGLPKSTGGKMISYLVEEAVPYGYEASYNGDVRGSRDAVVIMPENGKAEVTVINTLTGTDPSDPGTPVQPGGSGRIRISVSKVWNDAANKDGIRPEQVTINLLADGEQVESHVLTAAEGWKFSFSERNAKADGKDIVYTVTENAVVGYEASVTGNAESGFVVTNTHTPKQPGSSDEPGDPAPGTTPGEEQVEVSGYISWVDRDNEEGKRPSQTTLNLFADGTKTASVTVTEGPGGVWKYSFGKMNKYTYSKGFYAKDGIEDAGFADAGADPEAAGLEDAGFETAGAGPEAKPDSSDTGRREILYTVTEEPIADYDISISGFNVTNTYSKATLPDPGNSSDNGEKSMLISGEIIWEDSNNQNNTRPDHAIVRLHQDNSVVQQITVRPDISGRWLYEFQEVPMYSGTGSNQQRLQYALKQETISGYSWTASIVSQQTNGDTLEVTTRITDVLQGSSTVRPDDPTPTPAAPSEDLSGNGDSNSNSNNRNSSSSSTVNIGGPSGSSTTTGTSGYNGSSGSGSNSGSSGSSGSPAANQEAAARGSGRSAVAEASSSGNVKTGDETPVVPMIALAGISLALLIILFIALRRRRMGR